MNKSFEELDYRRTGRGELILRRRKVPVLRDAVVYEVILNGEFLMSSLFHAAEDALAHLAVEALAGEGRSEPLSLVVGGLGLGHTAAAALEHDVVGEARVVEIFPEIIGWHERGLVPLGSRLREDPRCRLIQGDFFTLLKNEGFDAELPGRRFDGILLDIDHTPEHWLHPDHAAFYSEAGLDRVRTRLRPGGVFAMWADREPDDAFVRRLRAVFKEARAELVRFPNPLTGGEACGTVYLGTHPGVRP